MRKFLDKLIGKVPHWMFMAWLIYFCAAGIAINIFVIWLIIILN